MKLFVKLIFVANFLFLGGGFLITFFQFIAYNGFGDIFEYVKPGDHRDLHSFPTRRSSDLLIRKCMNRNSLFTYQVLQNAIFMRIVCTIIRKFLS